MVNRASGPLSVAYILLIAVGIFFIAAPAPAVENATTYPQLVTIWGAFYLVGGVVAFFSLALRAFIQNKVSLWYFETAGLALLITANFIYAYALAKIGFQLDEYSIVAVSLVISAFSASLTARSIETLRLVWVIRGVAAGSKE